MERKWINNPRVFVKFRPGIEETVNTNQLKLSEGIL